MKQTDIDRINELYHLSQVRELTDAEKQEQQRLRKAYADAFRASLRAQLDNSIIVRPDGSKEAVRDRRKQK